MKQQLDALAVQDIMNGAALYASGGGGPIWMGQQIAKQIGDTSVSMVSMDEVADDSQMAITSFFGNPDEFKDADIQYGQLTTESFKKLESLTRKQFSHVLPLETGAGNSLIPIAVAANTGLSVVDVDGAHRAMPTPFGFTWMAEPIGTLCVTAEKSQVQVSGDTNVSALTAFSSMVFANPVLMSGCGVSMWQMAGSQMKSVAVQGSLSDSLALGKAIRESSDPVETAVTKLNGELIGIGTIKSLNVPAVGTGTMIFDMKDQLITVISSSENMIAWSSKQPNPVALAPDLISYITTAGQPLAALDLASVDSSSEIAIIRSLSISKMYQPPFLAAFDQVLASLNYYGKPATGIL